MGCHLSRDDWTLVNGEAGFALSFVAGSHPGEGLLFQATSVPKHGQRRMPPLNRFSSVWGGGGSVTLES